MGIRVAVSADAAAILNIYAPYITDTIIAFELEVPSEEDFSARMAHVQSFYPWLVWEEEGKVLGYAYAGRAAKRDAYNWNAELSIYLAPEAMGRGIGRALYGCLMDLLAMQGIQNVWGVIALPNDASCQLHESMGFRKMGVQHQSGFKMGRWIDVVYYEKALSDHPLPAPPLHAFSDLDAASVQQILDRWGNLS